MTLYNKVKDYLEINFILKMYSFVIKSGVCPETSPSDWLKTICFMYEKGWIYNWKEGGNLVAVVGAYLVNDDSNLDNLPDKEEGTIIYVPFAATDSDDKLILKKMMDRFIDKYPMATELIFFERNSDKKKRFKIGASNEQRENAAVASNA